MHSEKRKSIAVSLQIFSASILLLITSTVFAQEAGGSLLLVRKTGFKQYELQDHLNNSRAVVSDVKIPLAADHTNGFEAILITSMHYDPFGMELPDRTYSSAYRYGFNGKEKDDEWKGSGSSHDFGARIYDPRIGRWLSTDPLDDKYPSMSPYNFALNSPITFIDPDGRDVKASEAFDKSQVLPVFVMLSLGSETFRKMLRPFYEQPEIDVGFGYKVLGTTKEERSKASATWAATSYDFDESKGTMDVSITFNQGAFDAQLFGLSGDLNTEVDQNTTLMALTLGHEMFHAQLLVVNYKITVDKTLSSLTKEENKMLLEMADYKGKYGTGGGDDNPWHHEYIAREKRDVLIEIMKEYDKSMGITRDDEWYELMSWHGLTDTKAFRSLPSATQEKYKTEFGKLTKDKSLPVHKNDSQGHF